MKLEDLKTEIRKYYYMEDDSIIDVSLACMIANRLKIGDPFWLIIIGASSGGKTQILKPLSMTDPGFIHKVDDITENTFLSGANLAGGGTASLLDKIGPQGMITISDLTVLFSRDQESRNAVLSQFRMLYDGEMVKRVGNRPEPLVWEGYLGMIAGSTPSIYSHFEEVSDMGERFMFYRMKEYDPYKATHLALTRKMNVKELNQKMSELYHEYIVDIVTANKDKPLPELSEDQINHITRLAVVAERIRTTVKTTKYGAIKEIERIPVQAYPMRTAIQLTTAARAIAMMRGGELSDDDMKIIDWMGISLTNEEKRRILYTLAKAEGSMETAEVASEIGLSTGVTNIYLQNLAATDVIQRFSGDGNALSWMLKDEETIRLFTQ